MPSLVFNTLPVAYSWQCRSRISGRWKNNFIVVNTE